MNELRAMRVFAQVVDCGSFVNAARALDAAPAVVTRMVADLEDHLGARLLTRTTRRLALTAVGERYLERVRAIVADVEEAAALVRQTQLAPAGVVRVVASPEFAAHQLARRLPRFHLRCPQVIVRMTASGPVRSMLPDHDISIVIRQSMLDGEFVARQLARSEVIGCATPEYLDRYGRPSHPSELTVHRILTPPLQQAITFNRRLEGGCGSDEVVTVTPAPSQLHSVNPELHRESALAGLGIAGLPSYAIADALQDHRLEQVLPTWHVADLAIWACMPSRHHVPASTRAFMDFLLEEFGGVERDPWTAMSERPAPVGSEGPARSHKGSDSVASVVSGA